MSIDVKRSTRQKKKLQVEFARFPAKEEDIKYRKKFNIQIGIFFLKKWNPFCLNL